MGDTGRTLDVSAGFSYPAKAERARHDPKMVLLYADPADPSLAGLPVVLVQGYAAVRDANLQANTDRYLRLSMRKAPHAYKGMPPFLLRRTPWYFARVWIEVTPARISGPPWPARAKDQSTLTPIFLKLGLDKTYRLEVYYYRMMNREWYT